MGRGLDQKVGKYDVVDKVGEGGMGVVYKARDPLLGRIVAIKKMTGDFAARPEWRDRFFTEAKVVASLNHPNIVTLFDVGIDGENPYIVMEFLDGQGLDRLLASGQYMSAVQKIDYVIQVCSALQCAHSAKPNGIIHRDIKPANVIVLQDLVHVKLVDFGIAKIGGGQSGHSTTGMAIGTSGYMSPQQLLAKKDIDGRTDVFSTGVMLYQLFAGVLPWDAGDAIATAMKILNEPFPPLDTYVSEYPRELDDVLARALAKDVDDRYSSAEEMAWELQHVQERLKRGLVSDYVTEAKRAMERSDFRRAKDVLSDVLKLDTQNSEAREMMHELNQKMQREVSSEKVKNLQSAAEGAAARKQFTEAMSSIEQAIKLDKNNTDLLRIKDLIVADQKRYQDVRKKLNLAEAAQKMDDFQEALSLVDRALELDPTDTQARMMQAAIHKRINDQGKQKQVKELAEAARKEIQARQFTSAHDLISKLEAADPTFAEITTLKKAANIGAEQEQRRRDLQQAATAIQQKLAVNDYTGALQLATDALKKYSNEPKLLELKSRAESLKGKADQDRYIEEQVNVASRFLNDQKSSSALEIAEQLAVRFPADTRVQTLLERSRASAAQGRNDRRRADMLLRSKQALQEGRPEAAIHILETAMVEFPGTTEFAETLKIARQRAAEQKSETPGVVSEIERALARGELDQAMSTIDALADGVRNTPEIQHLREIAVDQRKKAGALNKKLAAVEQQIQQKDFTAAAEALAGLRAEHGDDPRIDKISEQLQRTRIDTAEREVTQAISKAEGLMRRSEYKEARATLETITNELLQVPRELQTKFSTLRDQITQAERAARLSADDGSTRVEDFRKPTPPKGTDVINFGTPGAGAAPAREVPKAEPKKKTEKQKLTPPVEEPVKEKPKTERQKAPQEAPAVARRAPAPTVMEEAEPKKGKGMIIGIAAALILIVAGAVLIPGMLAKTGTISLTSSTTATLHSYTCGNDAEKIVDLALPGSQKLPAATACSLQVVASTGEKQEIKVTVEKDQTTTQDVQFGAVVSISKPPVPPGVGTAQFDATPWASVVVTAKAGGKTFSGDTPLYLQLAPGDYTVEFTGPNGNKQKKNLTVQSGNGNELTSASFGAVNAKDIVSKY